MNIGRLIGASALTLGCTAAAFAGPIYISNNNGEFGTIGTAGDFHRIGTMLDGNGDSLTMNDIGVTTAGLVYGINQGNGNLYQISTVDAGLSLIGNTQIAPQGLTIRSDGVMFADDGANLYTVDLATGVSTLVGDMGVNPDGDFSFDDTGTLYMCGNLGRLYTVDTASGAATEVGPMNVDFGFIMGTAFKDGVLYGLTNEQTVWTIDRATGAATLVGSYSGDPTFNNTFGADTAPAGAVPDLPTVMPVLFGLVGLTRLRRKRA
jgi:hypothetical protein